MTALAPHLSNFLREHLPKERSASQHTCEAYAHSFQLLLCFAASRLKLKPAKIEIEQLDPPLILAFLARLGIITPQSLRKNRKYAIVFIAVLAAAITPTVDPMNMMLVMGPLFVLYELGVLLSRITYRPRSS